MRDQTNQLDKNGISATFLGSAQLDKSLEGSVFFGDTNIKVLFVTPEWLFSSNKMALVKGISESGRLRLVAIDEAHLVFDWKTFRGKYGQLVNMKELPNVPVIALTATTTPDVMGKLCGMLDNATVVKSSVNRPSKVLCEEASSQRSIDRNIQRRLLHFC